MQRMLTDAHKQTRTVAYQWDKQCKGNFIQRFVTVEESWIHHYGVETKI